MNRFTLFVLGLVAASGALGCSDRDPSTGIQDRSARARFVNATADATSLTARVEGVDRAVAIGIGSASPCVTLDAGVAEITFLQPGVSTAVASTITNFAGGGRYVVIASGSASNARVLVVETGGTPPLTSTALRVVNATGTLASVDVHVTTPDGALGGATQSGLVAHGVTPTFSVNAGPARIRITTAGTTDVLLDTGAISLTGGELRVLVIAGAPGDYRHFFVDRCS